MIISNKTVNRKINNVDYIPLQLRTGNECQATEYYSIRKGDRSIVEFAFDNDDATIHRITLLICEEYCKISEPYCIPNQIKFGDVLVEKSGETESPVFRCEIYPNAVKIVVSNESPCECIMSENVVWELTDQGDLISLSILDPTGEMSDHCFKELEAN